MAASAFTPRYRQNQPIPPSRSRMPSLFNTIRLSIYGAVLLFTVICLAMAGHFQTVLAASDLTRFVPFAIFVCTASLFIFTILVAFSVLLRERNPISTRIELASLGLAGVFWLVLGVYLTTSESQDADVECFMTEDSTTPVDDEIANFHTDQFQAMYRVLTSFALMNAILVLASCLILLVLALRRHRNGDVHMWHGPVTSCAWFNTYNYKTGGAVAAAAPAKRAKKPSVSGGLLPTSTPVAAMYTEKPQRRATRESRRTVSDTRQPLMQEKAAPAVVPASASRSTPVRANANNPYMHYYDAPLPSLPRQARRHTSGNNGAASVSEFEAGLMLNPYSNRPSGRSGGRGGRS